MNTKRSGTSGNILVINIRSRLKFHFISLYTSTIDELKKILQEIQESEHLSQEHNMDMSRLRQYIKQHGLDDSLILLFMCGYVCSLPLSTRDKFFECLFDCLDYECILFSINMDTSKTLSILKNITHTGKKEGIRVTPPLFP